MLSCKLQPRLHSSIGGTNLGFSSVRLPYAAWGIALQCMHASKHSCRRRASYCEIYNEALYDLLHWTREQLQVRWDAARGFHVPGLALAECATVGDLLNVRPLAMICMKGSESRPCFQGVRCYG